MDAVRVVLTWTVVPAAPDKGGAPQIDAAARRFGTWARLNPCRQSATDHPCLPLHPKSNIRSTKPETDSHDANPNVSNGPSRRAVSNCRASLAITALGHLTLRACFEFDTPTQVRTQKRFTANSRVHLALGNRERLLGDTTLGDHARRVLWRP